MSQEEILTVLNAQNRYLKDHSYRSYDLCDITSQSYFLKMNKWCHGKAIGKYVKYPHNLLLENFTPQLRNWYKVEKRDFAQSNAFIVRGLIRLFHTLEDESYLHQAEQLISRIQSQKSPGFKHACWGQPYDWFSKKVIPAFTPRTTVTSQVGRMYMDLFWITKNDAYLREATNIGDFFLEEMPLSYDQDGHTCYAYTTIDQHQVHNPNMMACGFLIDLWDATGDAKFRERALSAARFTFSRMNANGSWYYANLPNNTPSKIDNYHTGYNLEGAVQLKRFLRDDFPYDQELKEAIAYYQQNLFDQAGIPKLTNTKRFPIDIQCCAQSIITHTFLAQDSNQHMTTARELYKWTTDHMYADGSYYYRISKNGSVDQTDYIRWGDAWMFFAGSLLISTK